MTVEHRALPLKHLLATKLLALAPPVRRGVPINKGAKLAKHVDDVLHLQKLDHDQR